MHEHYYSIIPFSIIAVVLSLRDASKNILSKSKWGAQAVVRGARPPWPSRSDGTAGL